MVTSLAVVFAAVVGSAAYHIGSRLQKVQQELRLLTMGLQNLARIGEAQLTAADDERAGRRMAAAGAAATTVTFSRAEIHQPKPETGELGIGVFGVRNNGSEAVFALGLTRSAADGPPREATPRGIGVIEIVELTLVLPPDEPALELAEVALWYRDSFGQLWVRRFADHRATFVPAEEAPVEEVPVAEVPVETLPVEEPEADRT
ncbi:hypothetical protein ACFO3J_00045 [Streptomyces polygonati]|uniref:Uncharacterized protein n=1 Tax=Streptomyces polygonati TaxID=1617087 RepID=A0ABV8HCR3_9ACTN